VKKATLNFLFQLTQSVIFGNFPAISAIELLVDFPFLCKRLTTKDD